MEKGYELNCGYLKSKYNVSFKNLSVLAEGAVAKISFVHHTSLTCPLKSGL